MGDVDPKLYRSVMKDGKNLVLNFISKGELWWKFESKLNKNEDN